MFYVKLLGDKVSISHDIMLHMLHVMTHNYIIRITAISTY